MMGSPRGGREERCLMAVSVYKSRGPKQLEEKKRKVYNFSQNRNYDS